MGRKRKGNAIHGWLLVAKPAGVGSTDVVNRLRWQLKAQKAGHAGTLDPDATGLLPVAFGHATRLLPFLEDHPKTYHFEVNWGTETTTDDASGEITLKADTRPNRDQIQDILPLFTGEIMQVPPQVSAVHVNGERAYDLAREGVIMDLKARPLTVYHLEILAHSGATTTLAMTCGKGGYVRSLARDLGRGLGTCAHVKWLHRAETCGFSDDEAVDFNVLREMTESDLLVHLLPPEDALRDFTAIELDESEAADIYLGREITQPNADNVANGSILVLMHANRLAGIGELTDGTVKPVRVFHLTA